MSFETALTGLNAASQDLDVTGNNIANSGTTGFKASRAEFADIFASAGAGTSGTAIGQGVRLSAVTQQFTQGQFNFTGNGLDLAINGNGFFRLDDGGTTSYTRAGNFRLDRDGYLATPNGQYLEGFTADSAGNINNGNVDRLQINTGNVAPNPTSTMTFSMNLDASDAAPTTTPFDSTDSSSYNFSTSTTVYDSQGGSHIATSYWVKTGSNTWDTHMILDGDPALSGSTSNVTFNPNGSLVANGTDTYNIALPGGVSPLNIDVDYSSMTQFGSDYNVSSLTQNGYADGQFSDLSIEQDGRIFARFTNGQSQVLGQVVLSRFPSPEKLKQVGDTSWVETFGSGTPIAGAPGGSGLGTLQSGALEQSNVNTTEQLVKMITAQRNFQANAKMISTEDQITQDIINIR